MLIQRSSSTKIELSLKLEARMLFDDVEDFEGFSHDFGSDMVTW